MSGALLSEVWPDMVQKPKKAKRLKKKKDDIFHPPMTPDEMETELLGDNTNTALDPRQRLSGMGVNPYTDNEIQYQDTKKTVDLDLNDNIVRPDNTRSIKRAPYEEDPEYEEFLEFKKRRALHRVADPTSHLTVKPSSKDDQFNELLLYIFTGFFLLMIYDGIYTLGKRAH